MFGKSNSDKARELYFAGNYADAIPKFKKAVASGDLYADDVYNDCIHLAVCYYNTNDSDTALSWLKEALKWKTDDHFVYYWFSEIYRSTGEFELALKYANEAIQKKNDAFSWYAKACALQAKDELEKADDAIKTAIELAITQEPNSVEDFKNTLSEITVRKRLTEIHKLQKDRDYKATITKCNELLNASNITDETKIELHNILSTCYFSLKQYNQAISECKASLNIDSETVLAIEAFIELAANKVLVGDITELLHLRDNVLKILDNSLDDSNFKEMTESEANNAKKVINDAIHDIPIIFDILQLSGNKKYDEVLAKYAETTIFNSDFREAIIQLVCEAFVKTKKFSELFDYVSSHIADYNNGSLDVYLGIAYYYRGIYETAIQCIDRGINTGNDDTNADAWWYKGECHFQLREYDKAIDAYMKAFETKEPFGMDHPNGNEFDEASLGERIRVSKEKLAQAKSQVIPSHITIQGNSAPISFGGVIATDDAVINRSNVTGNSETNIESNFCPQCGQKVEPSDAFCRKCGRKLA